MVKGDHGSEAHKVLIRMAMHHLEKQGWRILDHDTNRIWKQYMVPSVPDILAEMKGRSTTTQGLKTHKKYYLIVEIETKATKANIRNKERLYEMQIAMGWRLVILDCRKIKGWKKGFNSVRIKDIKQWLGMWLI